MQFVYGLATGIVGFAAYDLFYREKKPQEQADPARKELEERLATTLSALAGTETANKQIAGQLELSRKRCRELEERVNGSIEPILKSASTTVINGNAPTPPPPPAQGKNVKKRSQQTRIDTKTLLTQFAAFVERAENKVLLDAVKAALRLDFPTLTKTTESAIKTSLSNILGKWLKEQKLPENIESDDWEEAVDESLADIRSEKLDRYQFPNAALFVKDGVSFLRNYFQPKNLATQGQLVDELTEKLAKRPKREIPNKK